MFALIRQAPPQFKRKVGMLLARSTVQSPAVQRGRGRIYLNVGHTGLDHPGLERWAARLNVRPVLLVADLIPVTHPEFCRPGEKEKHEQRMENLLRAGAGVIGISQDTLDELSDFAERRGLSMPPAIASHIGIKHEDVGQLPEVPPFEGRPYFIMLGTIEGRKNHLLLLNIWRELTARLGDRAPMLLVIGQRGWECEQVVDILERCERVRGHVIELSRLPDATVLHYLRHARALLFPSFVEGYGIPLVEALSLRTPVIASDLNVFRELAGDIPDYLSPIDGAGWMRAIIDYSATDSAARAAQIGRLQGYRGPDWGQHFVEVDAWLSQMSQSASDRHM
ncbi:glycosyltransferase family 1 protein [Sphingobium aquiterrae]|uniref:glycosyltransferase family 4 protein n=1 Tax=Sphingobium aquiterrae TaxID=2038656 RepID=UPI003017FAF2